VLRACAPCSKCGRKGASLTAPSWDNIDTGFATFPREATLASSFVINLLAPSPGRYFFGTDRPKHRLRTQPLADCWEPPSVICIPPTESFPVSWQRPMGCCALAAKSGAPADPIAGAFLCADRLCSDVEPLAAA
jgi:hypothetical protein